MNVEEEKNNMIKRMVSVSVSLYDVLKELSLALPAFYYRRNNLREARVATSTRCFQFHMLSSDFTMAQMHRAE